MVEIRNPELRKQIHQRNIIRFRQVLTDLTNILQKIESGEMEDIWFIRRLTVAVLGATKMTDEKGQLRWIGWKDGKLVKGPVTYERPGCQLHETRLTGAPPVKPPPGFTAQLMHDAAEEEQRRRDGVVLQ
jgi:hypothetical protein